MTATPLTSTEIRMGRQGRIVVPAPLRSELGFAEGERLIARIEDGELRISSVATTMQRLRECVRSHVPPHASLVDDLLADRRRETRQEHE